MYIGGMKLTKRGEHKTRRQGDKMQEAISWAELAELTHKTQVEKFQFCSCEEQEYFPYEDCPRETI
jgi:hypothetical protein